MRKLSLLTLFLFLLCSCDMGFLKLSLPQSVQNPFSSPTPIYENGDPEEVENGGTIRFIAMSDAHFGRSGKDSNVSYGNENFFSFLQGFDERVDFFAFTGDMMDTFSGKNASELHAFCMKIKETAKENSNINAKGIYVVGNHDFVNADPETWVGEFADDDFFPSHALMGSYSIGDVAIYKTDSSYRVFGGVQLNDLDAAMNASSAKYNLILNHVPLAADTFDQTLFEFVIADANERNMMLKILSSHKPSLMLSGHHHKGNILNTWSSSVHEIILAAYHRRDIIMDLESKGYWYVVEIDQSSGKVTIKGYRIDDITKPDKTWSFFLD